MSSDGTAVLTGYSMENSNNLPQHLFVYECRGPRSPGTEPALPGFLGLWPEPPFYYLFFDRESESAVKHWIQDQSGWILNGAYSLDYEQWQHVSLSDQRVGPFLIHTGKDEEEPIHPEGGYLIRMNPGLVFGSGLHPTTRGCLLTMAELFKAVPVKTVVDLGTGTGILAIAGALLGATRVVGLDCIPLAVAVALQNVRANHVEERVKLLVARELEVLREPSDLLLMNIEWPCLREVLRGSEWRRYPRVIMSGFLAAQWKEFEAMLPSGHRVERRTSIEDWMTAVISGMF